MQNSKLTDWQNPFVDVFKRYNTFQYVEQNNKSNVLVIHDPSIARKCLKLSASVPSNCTINIPTPSSEIKNCDLIGRYLYIELQLAGEKYFNIHIDVSIREREPGVRFTITNIEKQFSVASGNINVLKIPFTPGERNLWTILCVDIQHHLENYGLFAKGAVKNFRNSHIIKGIQICANLTIRGIYTSSNIYDWNSLPKQMGFKLAKGGRWSDQYNFIYLPSSINPEQLRKKIKKQQKQQYRQENEHNIIQEIERRPIQKQTSKNVQKQEIKILPSEQYLELNYALAFSPIYNPDILFKQDTIYYSSGSLVVSKSLSNGQQQFLQGHTDYICAMDSFQNWIVTVQRGSKAIVRIWIDHKCISSFQGPYQKVQQIRISHKKYLAMVGTDGYNRQVIIIFNINDVQSKKKPVFIAKQVSDFNILTIKFSPVQNDKLVSCGRQNIRFWREKNQHLPGSPVILNHHARNTIFTVLDFQYCYDDPNPITQREKIKRVYVGSQNGLLFQVNYNTHLLQQVYKLHDSAICSIALSVGFCVTGGQDQVLRVWPLDFSEFILEAQHEGVITSLAISEDGLHVACGTSTGGLGILDLTNHNYKTILRSHTDNVIQMVYHEYSGFIITLSQDLTIRLWDPEKLQQTYQFTYPKEDACTCISGNPLGMYFAAGFKSGILRIFDIEKTCINEQIKQHSNEIVFLEYSLDGKYLIVLEEQLTMIYSPLHSHQPIKHLPIQIASKYQHAAFSADSNFLTIIGDSGTHINIWETKSLQMMGKIFTGKLIKKLKFCGESLWVIFQDSGVRRYNITNMTIEAQMQALHRGAVNNLDFDLKAYLLFSVGDDSLLKIWDYSFQRQPHQVYIGHVGSINGVLYKNNKIWTIGAQGMFQWNMRKNIEEYQPPLIKGRSINFIKNVSKIQKVEENKIESQQNIENFSDQLNMGLIENKLVTVQRQGPVLFSQKLRKKNNDQFGAGEQGKFTPQKITLIFAQKTLDYKKSKKKQHRAKIINKIPQLNIKYSLPQKHFFQEQLEQRQRQYQTKIQLIKQNRNSFKIKYLIGFESYAHDNLVWNYIYGWFAYTLDNLIIIETLSKQRSQKIIPLPERISMMLLSKDMKRLICSSQYNPIKKLKGGAQTQSENDSQMSIQSSDVVQKSFANIYILSKDFQVQKKLSFHPKGIQSIAMNETGKFLVSVGNFRQCTVCVWQIATGKLKASSYTLDKINDVKTMEWQSQGRALEFVTVGRDQLHFWGLTRDDKLEYYDVFIPKGENEEIAQITACDYVYVGQTTKILIGLTTGQILVIQYGTFKTLLRRTLATSQIISIRNVGKKAIVTSADGNIYFWSYDMILKEITAPNFQKLPFHYSVNSFSLDPEGDQGLVGTSEGIYYSNLKQSFSSLLVGSFTGKILLTKLVNQNYFVTAHDTGRLKLWNIETGQEIKTYKWKSACRELYFDDTINKMICFCQNNNQIKFVNLKKFTKEETYTLDETVKPDYKSPDYPIKSYFVTFGGRAAKWIFTKKGEVYAFEQAQEGRKKIIRYQKVLEFSGNDLADVQISTQKSMIFTVSVRGTICSYAVDLGQLNKFEITLMDKIDFSDQTELKTGKNLSEKIEKTQITNKNIHMAPCKSINQTYIAICETLQYVYFRNYMKRVTLHKIILSSFPLCVTVMENKKDCDILIGLWDGSMEVINGNQPQNRYKVQSIINNPIENIIGIKSKQLVILTHKNGLVLYNL